MRNMNQNQIGVAVFLALLIAAGWLAVPGGRASQAAEQAGTLETARQYRDQELYERSIQSYAGGRVPGALSGAGRGIRDILRGESHKRCAPRFCRNAVERL